MTFGNRSILLDTSAYSWFRRGEPQIVDILEVAPKVLLTTVVIGELLAGFEIGSRKGENVSVLQQFLSEEFVYEVAVDRVVAEHYAIIFAELRTAGTPIPTNDIWIAACSRANGALLVSFDRDFERVRSVDCHVLEVAVE